MSGSGKGGVRLRPIGGNVLVLFPNGDWRKDDRSGFIAFDGIYGTGYRMDGIIVSTNRHTPGDLHVGTTVYGDPLKGRTVIIDGTLYHLMRTCDIEARAVSD